MNELGARVTKEFSDPLLERVLPAIQALQPGRAVRRRGLAVIGVMALVSSCVVARVEHHSVPLEEACGAARRALADLNLPVLVDRGDFQECFLRSQMANGQRVTIICRRQDEKITQVRVTVGDFDSAENRSAAASIREQVARNLGVAPRPAPPPAPAAPEAFRKTYRASVSACYEAAIKECRERDYRAGERDFTESRASIRADGKEGRAIVVSMVRLSEGTSIEVRVSGTSSGKGREEAKDFHEELADKLKERGRDD